MILTDGRRHGGSENDDAARPAAIFTWGIGVGAFGNLARSLARGMVEAGGGPVDLLYLGPRSPAPLEEAPPGVRLVPLPARRSATSPLPLLRYLRRVRPRALVTMPTIITIPSLLAYRLGGRRVRRSTLFVIYQGDTLGNDVRIDHARKVRLRLMPALARWLFTGADALTACAPGVVELMEADRISLPKGSAHVIPNPVDVDAYARHAADPPSHPWLVDKSGPVITTLARLVPRKNHAMLLRAVARVREQGQDARLILFGEGPELDRTRALAERLGLADVVSFPGFTANPHADIAHSDLFVMSSDDEAFCLALVEAMACGVPVISTDAVGGGPRSILAPSNEAGEDVLRAALVPCADDESLADAIVRCLSDARFRDELSAAGRRRADAFTPRAIGAQWVHLLDELEGAGPATTDPGT
jgi:glycosyltransferase involved in cell wall biosynthesis